MITGTAHLANVVYYLLLIWEILSSDGKSRDTLSVLVLALTVLVPSLILRG